GERVGGRDGKLRIEMQLELKRLQTRLGVTVIYVTHDQEEALTLSDRIAVMNQGRIEQLGDPTELYESPRTAFVAQFIGESNRLEGVMADAPDGRVVLITPSGLRLPARAGGAPVGESAVLFLRPERIAIASGGEGGGEAVSGEVVEAVFVGESMRYLVHASGGEAFTVKRLNADASDRFKVGARVRLSWSPDAAFTQRRSP